MLLQFLNVLIQVLVIKSHDLLQEEIGITIYNMASVDFDSFYANFLPQFLASCEGVDQNQKTILGQNFKMDKVIDISQNVSFCLAPHSLGFHHCFYCFVKICRGYPHSYLNPYNAEATFVQNTSRQRFLKPSKPCHVGIHWIALAKYSQMGTLMPGFLSLSHFFVSFCNGQISHLWAPVFLMSF